MNDIKLQVLDEIRKVAGYQKHNKTISTSVLDNRLGISRAILKQTLLDLVEDQKLDRISNNKWRLKK